MPHRPSRPDDADVWPALRDALSEARLLSHHLLRSSHLSMGQALTMHWIGAKEGLRLSALADGLGITRPAATSLVTSLESRGWACRDRSPADRRGVVVRITPKGRELLATFDRQVEGIVRTTLRGTPRGARVPTVTTLRTLESGIRDWRERAQGTPRSRP
jgi:DNA-binding MarR family transcriptional regulator